jgi:spermidine synthase
MGLILLILTMVFDMKVSPLVSVYSLTLLLSAALLFSVQPMFSKMVLPMLGGTPQVWITCMLFFQLMLLGGYAYAHGTTRYLSIRAQAALHIVLLIIFTVVLPIGIPPGWEPPTDSDPTLWQLTLMLTTVGGPFFVLAGSAPMLQRWFSVSGHKDADNPYFLYGASNLGSMTALLAYPVLIEPFLDLPGQSHTWMLGYVLLIAFTAFSGFMIARKPGVNDRPKREAAGVSPITWRMRITWLTLAFIPSSLMLGVTTFITTDIASVPLLWILPLALYVGTFIIVFARKPIISIKNSSTMQALMLILLISQKIAWPLINPYFLIVIHMAVFFFSALTCHLELAKSRPDARYLTEFYLIMSIGGAIGGFFNAIIAPQYLIIPLEYVFALVLACFARSATDPAASFNVAWNQVKTTLRTQGIDSLARTRPMISIFLILVTLTIFLYQADDILMAGAALIACGLAYVMEKRWQFASLVAIVLVFFPLGTHWSGVAYNNVIHRDRNFFGVLKVADTKEGERLLLNGTTNHGTQAKAEKYRLTPLSYYGMQSPLRDAYKILDQQSGQHVGVIGLGIGVTACFKHKGRDYDYYEINPLVKEIAENPEYFTFLSDCGSPYKIILGDGRMTIKKQPDNSYNMIVIDAFTSDNIPIHLMTLEAIELYFQKLKHDGVLVIHISNRFLDLEPVLQKASEAMGIRALAKVSDVGKVEDSELMTYASHWVAFSRNEQTLKKLEQYGWSDVRPRSGIHLWTDQYSNIFMVLNNMTGMARGRELEEKTKADKARKAIMGEPAK